MSFKEDDDDDDDFTRDHYHRCDVIFFYAIETMLTEPLSEVKLLFRTVIVLIDKGRRQYNLGLTFQGTVIPTSKSSLYMYV